MEVVFPRFPALVRQYRVPFILDNVQGALDFRWNTAVQLWSAALISAEGDHIYGPVFVTTRDTDLFCEARYLDIPPGRFFCRGPGVAPGPEGFRDEYQLVYEKAE